MKILLTGAGGFIGKKLLAKLVSAYGKEAICLLTSKAVPGFDCILYKSHRDLDLGAYDVSGVNVVIHAGAYTPKNGGEANIIEQCNNNVYFTEQLLQLPFNNLKKIINLSTLDVYANAEVTSETSIVDPVSFYGMSKLYCEKMVKAFAVEKKIDYQTLRIGHVYGPGEEEYKKIIPITMANVLGNRAVEIWGDGSDLRSFIYIDDVVVAIVNAVENVPGVDIVNVVSGNAISIKDLVAAIVQVSGKQIPIVFKESHQASRNLVFDNNLLRAHLLGHETDFLTGLMAEYQYMAGLSENNI